MSQNWLNVFDKNPYKNTVDDEMADDDISEDAVFGFPTAMPITTDGPNVPVPNKVLTALLANQRTEMLKDMVVFCCCIVVFCQIGFGLYHCGLSRSKNALLAGFTIILNTFFVLIGHWATGFTFATTNGTYVIGYTHFWFSESMPSSLYQNFLHSFCFSVMTMNIIPGGLLERVEPCAIGTLAIIFSVIVHPIVIHSAWHTDGWLQTVQIHTEPVLYQDFAGSGTVHVFAGIASLVGSFLLGPRFRRYSSVKKQNFNSHLLGHSSPLCVLGGFIMVLGFICLHISRAYSDASIDGASIVVLNTLIAISTSSITAVTLVQMIRASVKCCCWDLCKVKWPVMNLFINGAMAGIAAIAAGCNVYYPWSSAVVGIVAGFAYVFWSFAIAACSIDDPADVFATHAGGGLWGVIAVAIFGKNGIIFYPTNKNYKTVAWNITGGASIAVWSALMTLFFLGPFRVVRRLRVTKEMERTGLDISLFGEMAYPFYAWRNQTDTIEDNKTDDDQSPSGYPDTEQIQSVPIDRRHYVGFYDF